MTVDVVLENFVDSVCGACPDFRGEVRRSSRGLYGVKERWHKRHTVCGNQFDSRVLLNTESADFTTECSEGSDGRASEFFGGSGNRFRWP